MAVLAERGLEAPVGVAVGVGFLTVVELVTLVRFLRAINAAAGPPFRPPIKP
jgi:hypothetical protein